MPREISLEQLHVPVPCSADWNAMAGDDRRRYCGQCRRHVVDLSAHTRAEAEAIVAAALPGGLCAQFRFDAGGRMVTRDAPPRRPGRRVGLAATAVLAFVASIVGCKRPPEARVVVGDVSVPTTQSVPLPGAVSVRGDATTSPTTRPVLNAADRLGAIAMPASRPAP